MTIRVRDVAGVLTENSIEFALSADESNILSGPVDWAQFDGRGLAFYAGDDIRPLQVWDHPEQGLIVCRETLRNRLDRGPFLFVAKPRLAFTVACGLFETEARREIHPSAVIAGEARIGKNVSIGPLSVIGEVQIGDGTVIGALVSITERVEIGRNVRIMDGVHIGNPGLGSIEDVSGDLVTFPHFERVIIEDGVVIGTGTVVNRGALTPTVIGKGSHISMNCVVGHNSRIGQNVFMAPGVLVAGSVEVGERCFLGQGCCLKEGVRLAPETTVGTNATVLRSCTEPGTTLVGVAATQVGKVFGWKRE